MAEGAAPVPARSIEDRAKKVRLILMDVDGVLTDGRLFYLGPSLETVFEAKGFDAKDGLGLRIAREAGLRTGVISGRSAAGVEARAKMLQMEFVIQGRLDKLDPYREILSQTGLSDESVAYIGDDVADLPLLARVGLPIAVGDAVEEVRRAAALVTRKDGGRGAVREAVETILKAQGLWEPTLRKMGWHA